MKKYIYLFLSTLIVSAAVILSGYMVNGNTAETEIFLLRPQDMDNTITSSGKLQYKSGKSIKMDELGIIKSVDVKSGDQVKKGDILFSYYQAEQLYHTVASQYTDIQNVSGLLGNIADTSIKQQLLEEVKKYCTVKEVISETDGKVTSIEYSVDDIAEKGTDMVKLSDTGVLEVPININENYINRVQVNQKAEITFNAVPDRVYTGKVTKISDEAVQTSGLSGKETTVNVIITLDDKKDDQLRIGYSADCSIVTSTDKDILVLPYEYIRSDDEGDYVLTAVKNKAKKVYIKTGKEYKDGTEILAGLQKDDQIIKSAEITEGQSIIIKQ